MTPSFYHFYKILLLFVQYAFPVLNYCVSNTKLWYKYESKPMATPIKSSLGGMMEWYKISAGTSSQPVVIYY